MTIQTEAVSSRAADLLERADAVLATGLINQLRLPGGKRLVIESAAGSQLIDADGERFVDYLLGSGPMVVGHAHPAVVEAVQRQSRLGSTYYAINEPAIELAERLVELVPCAELVRYCSTGSEATLFALRLARAATGRDAVLKFEGGFHGSNDYAVMSLTPEVDVEYPSALPSSSGIPKVLEPEVLVAPFNDIETTRGIIERHSDRLAAIIVEPLQRGLSPQPGFLESLRSLADRHQIVLVFDEVVTGFRLAAGGAQELFGVVPDLATFGKILGGGYPLAAVAGRSDVMACAAADPEPYVSGTLSGNPVGAAAGLATLELLTQPGAYARLASLGDQIRAGISDALTSAGHDAHVIGAGPIFQVVFSKDEPRNYRELRDADQTSLASLSRHLIANGHLYTAKKGYLSLAHDEADIKATVATVAQWARAESPSSSAA